MNKQKTIIIIVAVLLLAIVGSVIFILVNNSNNQSGLDNQYTNISEDTFIGKVIAIDKYQVTVIPNEDELIRQSSFEIVNAVISDNTKITLGEAELTIEEVMVGDSIKVTFDGKIYEVKPGKIIAQKLEILTKPVEQ